MRVFLIGGLLSVGLSVLAMMLRDREPAASNVLFGFALLVIGVMVAAFFEWI